MIRQTITRVLNPIITPITKQAQNVCIHGTTAKLATQDSVLEYLRTNNVNRIAPGCFITLLDSSIYRTDTPFIQQQPITHLSYVLSMVLDPLKLFYLRKPGTANGYNLIPAVLHIIDIPLDFYATAIEPKSRVDILNDYTVVHNHGIPSSDLQHYLQKLKTNNPSRAED